MKKTEAVHFFSSHEYKMVIRFADKNEQQLSGGVEEALEKLKKIFGL